MSPESNYFPISCCVYGCNRGNGSKCDRPHGAYRGDRRNRPHWRNGSDRTYGTYRGDRRNRSYGSDRAGNIREHEKAIRNKVKRQLIRAAVLLCAPFCPCDLRLFPLLRDKVENHLFSE